MPRHGIENRVVASGLWPGADAQACFVAMARSGRLRLLLHRPRSPRAGNHRKTYLRELMSNPISEFQSSVDSIHELLAEWKIPGNDDRADEQSGGHADDSCVSNLWGSSQRDANDEKSGQSIDVVAAFALPTTPTARQ